MEMNNHESRQVSEMARVSDDLLGTGGLVVHQFNSSTGLSGKDYRISVRMFGEL